MLSRLNSSSWMEDTTAPAAVDEAAAWSAAPSPSSTAASSLLDVDPTWYLSDMPQHHLHHQVHHNLSDLLNVGPSTNASNIISSMGPTFDSFPQLPPPPPPSTHVPADHLFGLGSFNPMASFEVMSTSKLLRPLDVSPPLGAAPTLFQKRLARQGSSIFSGGGGGGFEEKRMKLAAGGGVAAYSNNSSDLQDQEFDQMFEDGSVDGSGLNYDSDEPLLLLDNNNATNNNGNGSSEGGKVTTSSGGGENSKGKNKKGMPAKNLMAERRRRKKLNDRLYMLRSVVPKISKMDRASILGDAIEYLKELLQRINDLHNELESTPSGSSLPTPTGSSFHPLTPTLATLPSRVKEELCPGSLPSPTGQPRVEVRVREGNAVNIHMFCARRPGLLLSTMRALDGLGLDIQQAVISCFNGFALDIFRAEQLKNGPGALPEEIKAILLHSAGFQGSM